MVQIARGLYQKIDREKMVKIMVLLLMLEWRWWCYWVIRGAAVMVFKGRERERMKSCVGDGVGCVAFTDPQGRYIVIYSFIILFVIIIIIIVRCVRV